MSARLTCTAASPMPRPAPTGTLWKHPDAEDRDLNDPYYDHYECPHCGEQFSVEVAE